jgi:DNA-binding transcriptional LysR family regulator
MTQPHNGVSGVQRMELRQLRYFVTLAEELHFCRAAAREHIVQSALSQQVARLERELGVLLLERSTHHVQLTRAGSAFLIESRQILAHLSRAAVAAQRGASSAPMLRGLLFEPLVRTALVAGQSSPSSYRWSSINLLGLVGEL